MELLHYYKPLALFHEEQKGRHSDVDISAPSAESPTNSREVLICSQLTYTELLSIKKLKCFSPQSIQHHIGVCCHKSTCKLSITFLAWLSQENKFLLVQDLCSYMKIWISFPLGPTRMYGKYLNKHHTISGRLVVKTLSQPSPSWTMGIWKLLCHWENGWLESK